ncbi:hypothetical protein B9Z55_027737 [Caenorhabditis nigoni]|uniref:SCP domain-containing protein n=1 Tax=Caenorhabditis nigoni TaxID=1611254 RepID=A0A2G5SEG9_9PELO|nr:hypothetical protein B9Z55_027737 [Caenorhabditis nigoni]
MKFLLLGAFFIGATLCQSTPHEYEELIGKLNFDRRQFAYRMNISNMYELHWDEKLNPKLWPEYRAPNSSFREMLIGREQNAIEAEVYIVDQLLLEIRNPTFWKRTKDSINRNRWPYWPFEHFLPTQKSIACDSRERKYNWTTPWKRSSVYRTICYLGPENSYSKVIWKHGRPGSACGNATNVVGLCRLKKGTKDPQLSHEVQNMRDFVNKLNFERREYAKAMNISNMYKLKWNFALRNAKDNMDSSRIPNFQKIYVFGNNDSYHYESHALKDSNYQLTGDISRWDEQLVEEHENGTLGFLTHLVPEQKAIGCFKKHYVLKNREIRGKVFNLEYTSMCHIGPERSLKNSVWKFGAPGTGCGSDKVEDGLCVGSLPKSYKPFGEFDSETKPAASGTSTSSPPQEEQKTPSPQAVPENSSPEDLRTPSPPVKAASEGSSSQELRTPSPHIKAATEVSNQQKYEELVAKLNYDRRELAKAMDVANMFKLVWNDENAKIAHELSKEFPIKNHPNRNYRQFFAGRNNDAIFFEKEATKHIDELAAKDELKEWTDRYENQTVLTLEQFLPTQSYIGCAPWNHPTPVKIFYRRYKLEYSTICVLTPASSFKDAEIRVGPAGSQCGGGQVEDGLCVKGHEVDDSQIH